MWTRIFRTRRKSIFIGALIGAVLTIAFLYLQNDINRNNLDPKLPFQIYPLPPEPNYTKAEAWYLNPAQARYYADPRKVDVFFVHGTTYDGGRQWLGPIESRSAQEGVRRIQLPNYAGPFAVVGNVYAPKYRQASLYTQLTLREDAREARQFAYRDVQQAFRAFLKQRKGNRGFVLVGIEQGGLLAARLIRDEIAPEAQIRSELVAAYLLETLVPESQFSGANQWLPVCRQRAQTGCLVSYLAVDAGRPDLALQMPQKAVYWQGDEKLAALAAEKAVCVNPLSGGATDEEVDDRHAQGATNATGLEWGTEPALIARQVSARCVRGLLFVTKPSSPTFRDGGTWIEKRKINSYNLFYGDLQVDVHTRWQTFLSTQPPS